IRPGSLVEDSAKPERTMEEDFGRRREDWVIKESPLLLGVLAPDLRLKNLNRTWETLLGYPRAMLLGKPLTRLIDQGEQAQALMLVNPRLVAEGRPTEFSLPSNDGSYRRLQRYRRPARGHEGMVATWLASPPVRSRGSTRPRTPRPVCAGPPPRCSPRPRPGAAREGVFPRRPCAGRRWVRRGPRASSCRHRLDRAAMRHCLAHRFAPWQVP